ncbi:hypothetical protein [Sphingobium fuliginis]|jgi:hypothetical protein|uniref:hypothetical protein n=1 Tax=Sphingobium fuliginis (strain ATCC 27551) TaxID=336203 RepID=UPI0037C9543F
MGEIVKKSDVKPPAQGGFKGAEYNAVATVARLEKICLVGSRFDVNPDLFGQQSEWKLSYGRKVKSCQFAPDSDCVMGVFEYHVTARVGRARAMQCTAEYIVLYEVPGDAPEAAAQGFCKNVGAFAAYPYFRGLVAHLFAEAGLSIPPLPAIASTAHIPPKPKAKELRDDTKSIEG